METPRRFTTLAELQTEVYSQIDASMSTIQGAVAELRRPLKQKLIRAVTAGVGTIISFLLLESQWGGLLTVLSLFGFVLWLVYEGYHAFKLYEEYVKIFDRAVYRCVFSAFGIAAQHTKGNKDELTELLQDSKLITETVHSHQVDDDVATEFNGQPLSITELHATRQEGSGKNRRTVNVFKGVFVAHRLPTQFAGETYISTEGDKYGFAHRNFFKSLVGSSEIEESELEWNEFENDLHVATNDGAEARYILTPEFMEELHEWWKEEKRNIRIAFKHDHCFVLFPDKHIKLGTAPLRLNPLRVKNYATNIATPLWHVFNLLEDVRTRFR